MSSLENLSLNAMPAAEAPGKKAKKAKPTKKADKAESMDIDFSDDENDAPTGKRLSVERIYQKKSQLEHILLRPDTYST